MQKMTAWPCRGGRSQKRFLNHARQRFLFHPGVLGADEKTNGDGELSTTRQNRGKIGARHESHRTLHMVGLGEHVAVVPSVVLGIRDAVESSN